MAERGIFSIVFIIRHRCHSWWLPFMTYFSRSHWEIPSHWVLIFPTVDFGRHIYPEPCAGTFQVFSQMAAMSPSVSILVHGGCCKKCHRLSGLQTKHFIWSSGGWDVQDRGTHGGHVWWEPTFCFIHSMLSLCVHTEEGKGRVRYHIQSFTTSFSWDRVSRWHWN